MPVYQSSNRLFEHLTLTTSCSILNTQNMLLTIFYFSFFFSLQSDWEHAFSSGLGNCINLLLCTFISFPVKNPSSATGVDLRLDVKRTNYWHLLDTLRVVINSKLYNPTDP